MKKTFLSLLFFCAAMVAGAQVERPKLVVGLVVDQMRWDYLYYYYDQYGEGGLKRLVDEGFSCENQMINYLPTVTAIGHSSVYTGSVPAFHGIAGNNFHLDGKNVYCCTDNNVKGIPADDSDSRMSPHNMLATTIGDQLHIATDYRSKVIGVALKDRASILPAGHSADAAYWWDTKAGNFCTSTYYADRLPDWVVKFNKENHTKPGFDIKTSNLGVTMTFKMAEAALENEQLGKHETTDMLCVSVSSTDAIGHTYGTRGKENHDVYMQLDRDLAHFLTALDNQVGRGNYLLFLTADHGAAHNPNLMNSHKIPAGGFDGWAVMKSLNESLKEKFGVAGNCINDVIGYNFHIDRQYLTDNNLDYDKVKAAAIEILRQDPQYLYVVDYDNLANTTMPEFLRERAANGYYRGRTGDFMVVTKPGFFDAKVDANYIGTNHGMWNPYDSHIPLVFFGWNIKHGSTSTPTYMVDTAPTVCAMLHIQMPNACVGNAIQEVVHQK